MNTGWIFFQQFLKNPRSVGALLPASKSLAREMSEGIDPKAFVVELGPGTGGLTQAILARLEDPKHYIGIELSEEFHKLLVKRFPRSTFVGDSADRIIPLIGSRAGRVDYIFSSLPITTMRKEKVLELMQLCRKALRPGGELRLYLFWHTYLLPRNQQLFKEIESLFELQYKKIYYRNLLPVVMFRFRASATSTGL